MNPRGYSQIPVTEVEMKSASASRRKRSESLKRSSSLGKTPAPIINRFQALILEAFEIKLSWDDIMFYDEKLADLRSSLMHWAGITDRDWTTVSRDAKAAICKPKAEEISSQSFTRKTTMCVNAPTETLVNALVSKKDSSYAFLQIHPFGFGNSLTEKNAVHMERTTLEEIDEDTHIIHTIGSKSKGSPPLWYRVSLVNVSRPIDGVAVIIQFPVKHPVAAEMDARKIYRDRTVMTIVIKSNAQDNRKSAIEIALMRHLSSRFRAMPKTFLRKIGERDVKEFSNHILSQVTSCCCQSGRLSFSASRRISEDFVAGDEGEDHLGDKNNDLLPVKRGKYIGILNSHFELVEILLSERSADWSVPASRKMKVPAAVSPGKDLMRSLPGVGSSAAEDNKDDLTLAGLTSLTKSLDYSPFGGINKVLRCQFTLRHLDPRRLAKVTSSCAFWQDFEPVAGVNVLRGERAKCNDISGCQELQLQMIQTGMNPWLGLQRAGKTPDTDGSIKVTVLGNTEIVHCLSKGCLKYPLNDKDFPPFFCGMKFEPRGKEDSLVTCAISIKEDENASDVQDRFVTSFKRALGSQLEQQGDYPLCCSFDVIDNLELPSALKGLFKGALMPFRFMLG